MRLDKRQGNRIVVVFLEHKDKIGWSNDKGGKGEGKNVNWLQEMYE